MTAKKRPNAAGFYAERFERVQKRKPTRAEKLRSQLERALALQAQSPDPHLARQVREIQHELREIES